MSRLQRFGIPFLLLFLTLAVSIGSPDAGQATTKEARGTVTAVTDSSLSVKAGTQEMKFTVDPKTTVTAEGAGTQARQAKAAGATGIKLTGIIKTGEAVVVNYTESGGTLRASEVRVVASAGPGGGGVTAPGPASRNATGTVKSITASTLVVTSSGKDMTLSVTPETSVVGEGVGTAAKAAGGKIAITSVVGAGDTVSVTYQESGTTMRATEVRITAKARK